MQKFPFRLQVWIFISLLAFCQSLISWSISRTQDLIVKAINQSIQGAQVSIAKIGFRLPNRIVCEGIVFSKNVTGGSVAFLIFPELNLKVSPWTYLTENKILVPDIRLESADVNLPEFSDFLRRNSKTLIQLVQRLPMIDTKVFLKGALIDLGGRNKNTEEALTTLSVMIRQNTLSVIGSLQQNRTGPVGVGETEWQKILSAPTRIQFQGTFEDDKFSFSRFALKSAVLESQLWGNFQKAILQLNGFVFVDTNDKKLSTPQRFQSIWQRLTDFKKANQVIESNTYLFEINNQIRFELPVIDIQQLSVLLNNIPIYLKGRITYADPVVLEITATTYARNVFAQKGYTKQADLDLKGIFEDLKFKGDGTLDLYFPKIKDRNSLEEIKTAFNGLVLEIDAHSRLALGLDQANATILLDKNEHALVLHDTNILIDLLEERFKFFTFRSTCYDGTLEGTGWFDVGKFPLSYVAHAILKTVDANQFGNFLAYFSKIYGRLSGDFVLQNQPKLKLEGELVVNNGTLKEFAFFKWLADSFALPSLMGINFQKLSSRFLVMQETLQLTNIALEAPDVLLKGYFHLDQNDLVSSQLSLGFTKKLLTESPKLLPILKIFSQEQGFLDFDFQLSGDIDAMNFQWLPSEVKQKIQDRIPNFIERKIERNIDASIDTNNTSPSNK